MATQCFFSKLSLFVSLFLKLNFIDSYVSSVTLRIVLYSEIYDAGITYIYNISFFDDNIFRGVIFRKEVQCVFKNDPGYE